MQTEPWQAMWDAFHVAIDLGDDERTRYLEGLDDPELRRELESLLAAHTSEETLLGDLPRDTWAEQSPLIGRRVGAYRVVEEIGRGGMGTVYLAERVDQEYHRQVAIKVVRRGMDTAEILARFRQERQILANLDHPNIARLIDGGTTSDGLPFFVMEHIQGEPIDRHCERLGLSLDRRLELFATVCEAVQYAHQNLIVHRDLKPSNILVTGEGWVKLLDFGIAKLLDPSARGVTTILAPGHRFTPEFASPEQLKGQPVTTASDVYALGVLLYLLLTGKTPLQSVAQGEQPSVEAVARWVWEREPKVPSDLVRERSRALGKARKGPEAHELTGDLDNIARMALEVEPGRRYSSVEQLATDLRRYREGLPVMARRGGWLYRTKKFVRRQQRLVVATAVALTMVLGFATTTAVQARRTSQALHMAEAESRRAEKVLDVLLGQLRIADPSESLGQTVTARELLEQGAQHIRRELEGQPDFQAELLHAIGQIHFNLGLHVQARHVTAEALAIHRSQDPVPTAKLTESLYSLARIEHQLGDYPRAAVLHREALELRRQHQGENDLTVAESLSGLAHTLQAQNDYETAERHLRAALEIQQMHPNIRPELTVPTLRRLGFLLLESDSLEAAEAMLQEALSLARSALSAEHPEIADTVHVLALVAYAQGDYELAEDRYQRALRLQRKLFGGDHPNIATTLTNLCAATSDKGDPKAEGYCREALAMQQRLFGDEHPNQTSTLNNLALLLHQKGAHDEAEQLYRRALNLNRKLLGDEHWKVAGNLNNLGLLLHDRGDLDAAEVYYREALKTYRKVLGEDHSWGAFSLNNLARLKADRGDYAGAEKLFLEALALRRSSLPAGHPQIGSSASWLGKLYVDHGQPERGEPLLREALEIRRAELTPGDWRLAETESLLGQCLAAQGRFPEAEPLLIESFPVLLERRGATDRRARQAVERAVELYRRWGRPEAAARLAAVTARTGESAGSAQ